MNVAEYLLFAAGLYLAVGFAFGIPFVIGGVTRMDPATRGTSAVFRLLILPGTVALWPIMLRQWIRGGET